MVYHFNAIWHAWLCLRAWIKCKMYCLALLIYHACTICLGIHCRFFPSRSQIYCLFLFRRLSPSHRDAVVLLSAFWQWSGVRAVNHVRLASLPYYPETCGRLQSPVKCQRGAVCNLSEQTLPQDTAAVFFLCNAANKKKTTVRFGCCCFKQDHILQ